MPTYITLVKWTQKGVQDVKESPNRLDAAKKVFRAAGGELKQFFLVSGQYDMIVISEAPDDETIARISLTLGSGGSIRTETVRAYTEAEYRNVIATLP
jgi:uncharacterized protein with GYD domain